MSHTFPHVLGNHTVAVVKGKEDYETLKASLSNVIRDANSLIDDGYMIIDGRKVSLEFFLGGYYKVIVELQAITKTICDFIKYM